jgi:heme-degrading monooxygenase HmoA
MHVIIWQFIVLDPQLEQFVEAYGSGGEWVRLFRRAEGYIGTDLLRSWGDSTLFLTVDRWESAACFDRFREDFSDEYRRLDARLMGLSASEKKVGIFSVA